MVERAYSGLKTAIDFIFHLSSLLFVLFVFVHCTDGRELLSGRTQVPNRFHRSLTWTIAEL